MNAHNSGDPDPNRAASGNNAQNVNHIVNNELSKNRNEVNRVAIKMPPFWREDPELWFSQLESQFSISGNSRNNQIFLRSYDNRSFCKKKIHATEVFRER